MSSSVGVAVFEKVNDNDVSTISDHKIIHCEAACYNCMEGCGGFTSEGQDLCDFGEEERVLREQVTPELGTQSSLNSTYFAWKKLCFELWPNSNFKSRKTMDKSADLFVFLPPASTSSQSEDDPTPLEDESSASYFAFGPSEATYETLEEVCSSSVAGGRPAVFTTERGREKVIKAIREYLNGKVFFASFDIHVRTFMYTVGICG